VHHIPRLAWLDDTFPRHVVAGLPHALPPIILPLRGRHLPLWIGRSQKQIAGRPIRMLAYNGSSRGPGTNCWHRIDDSG
jgi:hypothetical protein